MIVPYTKIPLKGGPGYFFQCLLPVTFFHGGRRFPVKGLVDTGASITTLNAQIADYFGITYRKCPRSQTYGVEGAGKPTWTYELEMEIDGLENSRISVPMQFIESKTVGAILGHGAFLNNFVVKFEAFNLRFEIDHRPDQIWITSKPTDC